MSDQLQFEIETREQFSTAFSWAAEILKTGLTGGPMSLFVGRPIRSQEQNDKMWPMLRDIAKQVKWSDAKLTAEEWKDIFTAAIKKQKLVPGLDGGLVVIGGHTSRMSRQELSELIELLYSFGTEKEVVWSEPSEKAILESSRRVGT